MWIEQERESPSRLVTLLNRVLPFSQAVEKLVGLCESASVHDVCDLIDGDQRLSTLVFRLANSPCHGLSTPVSELSTAVKLLGIMSIKCLALKAAVIKTLDLTGNHFDRMRYWRHAIVVAFTAQKIAHALKLPREEEVYFAGLLHDIGLAFLIRNFSIRFRRFTQPGSEGLIASLDGEAKEFGQTHPEIGAWIAARWAFPKVVCHGILHHHALELPGDLSSETGHVVGVLKLADHFARCTGHWFDEFDRLEPNSVLPTFDGRIFTLAEIDDMVGDLVPVLAMLDVLFVENRNKPVKA